MAMLQQLSVITLPFPGHFVVFAFIAKRTGNDDIGRIIGATARYGDNMINMVVIPYLTTAPVALSALRFVLAFYVFLCMNSFGHCNAGAAISNMDTIFLSMTLFPLPCAIWVSLSIGPGIIAAFCTIIFQICIIILTMLPVYMVAILFKAVTFIFIIAFFAKCAQSSSRAFMSVKKLRCCWKFATTFSTASQWGIHSVSPRYLSEGWHQAVRVSAVRPVGLDAMNIIPQGGLK